MHALPFHPRANVPVGGAPAGLVSWCVVSSSPVGTLVKPAGTIAYHVDGRQAWLNTTGLASGWITLASISAAAAEVAALSYESRTYWALRGRQLVGGFPSMGVGLPDRAQTCFDDMMTVDSAGNPRGTWTAVGTANRALYVHDDNGQGWQYVLTNAGVGEGDVRPGGGAAFNQWLKFHAFTRFRISSGGAPPATLNMCARMVHQDPPFDSISWGYNGPVSTIRWSLRILGDSATTLISTVPVDTAPHVHELYATDPANTGFSTHLTYMIDGVVVGTVPNPSWTGGAVFAGFHLDSTVPGNYSAVVSRYGATFGEF